MKYICIVLGSLFVVLGFIGIFVPLLPTTPFLLVSAALFVRSSDRLYNWLLNQKLLGPYVRNFVHKKGMPLHAKIYTLVIMWTSMIYSTFFIVENLHIQILLMAISTGVTIYILSLKTLNIDKKNKKEKES